MPQDPNRCCDLVMKGGVTSGVLYPSAVQEIAKKFHLVGIGGTSAGAIAACAAAAAEYRRRQTGSMEGFQKLEQVADDLSRPGALLSLFRPDRETAKDFKTFLKIVEGKAGFFTYSGLYFKRKKLFKRLVGNGFGLCTGIANGNVQAGQPALTQWLADLIDDIAGKQDGPLTFRDLHEAAIPPSVASLMKGQEARSIDLRAVTTCVTFGRPFELPFSENIFAFDPIEWSRLFPTKVIDHMVDKAGDIPNADALKHDGKLPMPNRDLPVVVAARMSLSFPVLFTMVPLWSVDYHRPDKPLNRCWFSDGGITSNFPLHRFDSLLPRWPTLGINLQYTDDSHLPQRHRLRTNEKGNFVYLPTNRSAGTLDLWNVFDRVSGKPSKFLGPDGAKLMGFLGGIFESAQSWHDNAFLKLPSYRDRLAEIWLTPEEGGMNLNMDAETIKRLVDRGRQTGKMIAERFADTDPSDAMSWEGHRWARFRSGIAGLMETGLAFRVADEIDSPGSSELSALLANKDAPPTYKFRNESQRAAAADITEKLIAFLGEVEQAAGQVCPGEEDSQFGPFCGGPRPPVDYGSRARF